MNELYTAIKHHHTDKNQPSVEDMAANWTSKIACLSPPEIQYGRIVVEHICVLAALMAHDNNLRIQLLGPDSSNRFISELDRACQTLRTVSAIGDVTKKLYSALQRSQLDSESGDYDTDDDGEQEEGR